MLEVDNIHAGYGSIKVLDGVTYEVNESEIVGIIGPNGAGKSTTFKAVFGLIDTWQGATRFKGDQITGLNPDEIIRRGLGYVMQGHRVFPLMTVRENLEMGGYTLESELLKDRIQNVYETFPALGNKSEAMAKTLSGGEKKMLELGMSLLLDPDLLMLDEPSMGLAPAIRSQLFEIVFDLRESQDISFLIIEQNIREVLEVADRAYVLEQGTVSMTGTGEELLNSPEVIDLYLGSAESG